MNDRLKYRMYDTNVNKMYMPNDFEEVECIYECIKQQINWDLDVDYDIKFNHLEDGRFFMQSTGLKDKNGKLIYEGDVIKFIEKYECSLFTNLKVVLFRVVWDNFSFVAKQIKIIQGNVSYEIPLLLSELFDKELYADLQTLIDIEVIGNIYENPELLKECE